MFKFRNNASRKRAERHPDFPEMSQVPYLHVLSAIETRRNVQRYLEIGSRSGASIARVGCSYAAVDPEFAINADVFNTSAQMMFFQQTSDDFFASGVLKSMGWVPDFAFIDGMHLFEFALRDFMNAEKLMEPGGVICLHDVCPFNYEMTTRDDGALERISAWTGDVWKVVAALLDVRPDLQVDVVAAAKTGLACVSQLDPNNRALDENYDALLAKYQTMELSEIGADGFYGRFQLVDPDAYIASL